MKSVNRKGRVSKVSRVSVETVLVQIAPVIVNNGLRCYEKVNNYYVRRIIINKLLNSWLGTKGT